MTKKQHLPCLRLLLLSLIIFSLSQPVYAFDNNPDDDENTLFSSSKRPTGDVSAYDADIEDNDDALDAADDDEKLFFPPPSQCQYGIEKAENPISVVISQPKRTKARISTYKALYECFVSLQILENERVERIERFLDEDAANHDEPLHNDSLVQLAVKRIAETLHGFFSSVDMYLAFGQQVDLSKLQFSDRLDALKAAFQLLQKLLERGDNELNEIALISNPDFFQDRFLQNVLINVPLLDGMQALYGLYQSFYNGIGSGNHALKQATKLMLDVLADWLKQQQKPVDKPANGTSTEVSVGLSQSLKALLFQDSVFGMVAVDSTTRSVSYIK